MSLRMVLGGIAEKMGSIVEFISGQSKITEANIEDTLKVSDDGGLSLYCILLLTTPFLLFSSLRRRSRWF
jgi:hypothetical protein